MIENETEGVDVCVKVVRDRTFNSPLKEKENKGGNITREKIKLLVRLKLQACSATLKMVIKKVPYISYLFILSETNEQGDEFGLEIIHFHDLGEASQHTGGSATNHGGVISTQVTKMPGNFSTRLHCDSIITRPSGFTGKNLRYNGMRYIHLTGFLHT